MVETILLEDIFTINDMDPGGKKFDKVSRVVAHSEQLDMDMVLDVNSEVYPVQRGDKFTVVLAPTLSLDGVPDEGIFDQTERKSLMDKFEYVMYGKLYKYTDDEKTQRVEVYVSFGGLLLMLKGEADHVKDLKVDQRLYLLMRRVG